MIHISHFMKTIPCPSSLWENSGERHKSQAALHRVCDRDGIFHPMAGARDLGPGSVRAKGPSPQCLSAKKHRRVWFHWGLATGPRAQMAKHQQKSSNVQAFQWLMSGHFAFLHGQMPGLARDFLAKNCPTRPWHRDTILDLLSS